jgi:hypothetical protein
MRCDAGGAKGAVVKRIKVATVSLALAASVFMGASLASAEEGESQGEPGSLVGCAANVICTYTTQHYTIPSFDIFCSVSGEVVKIGVNWNSATNRCGNKTSWLRTNGATLACMNPGGDRPSPGTFNEVFVPKEFGAFC